MSDTPRTDNESHEFIDGATGLRNAVVSLAFARALERERDEAREALRSIVSMLAAEDGAISVSMRPLYNKARELLKP